MEFSPAQIKAIRIHLKGLLPRAAFRPNPGKLVHLFVHAAIVIGCIVQIGLAQTSLNRALQTVVAGHSIATIAFFAHDLSHNAILPRSKLRDVLEVMFWTMTSTRVTLWRHIHNKVHHRNTNAMSDSIRYFARSERNWKRTLYSTVFIPGRYNRFNPLVLLNPVVTHLLHSRAALQHPKRKDFVIITNLGTYTTQDRLRLLFEIGLVVAWHIAVYYLAGRTWQGYLWAGIGSSMVGTMIASTYVYSQHSLHALSSHDNPFGSTTLILPRTISQLHGNIAHQTAHHLFEGLNTDYLPMVTDLLREHYPDALDELGPMECWRRIFKGPMYKANPRATPECAQPRAAE
jgi:fatty acid desaturase